MPDSAYRLTRFKPAFLFLLLTTLPFCVLRSQEDLKKYVAIMPPNVASFEKYGNVPVSYNTGQVAEVIPLYQFEIDANVSIPIQLSYNNNGMKPEDVPTWVGHGWDLLPGGYILQDVRGMDDLTLTGLTNTNTRQLLNDFMLGTMPSQNRYQYIKNAVEGQADTQHDFFSLTFLGKSLKFYFDGQQIKFIKFAPYKIVFTPDKNFEVTDEKGYKFLFGLRTGSSGSVTSSTEIGHMGGSNTWSLTKITTPYGLEATLTYQQDGIYTTNTSSLTYSMGVSGVSPSGCLYAYMGSQVVHSSSLMSQHILQSITCNGRSVQFNTITRNDLPTASGTTAKALSSIQVRNENNTVVKNIGFSYTNSGRLKLDQVSVLDNVTNAQVQKYLFDYHTAEFLGQSLTDIPLITHPNRTYAIDHWGYYNGQTGNTFAGVPKAKYKKIIPFNPNPVTGDNDRHANGDASRVGMLKKITYPTGGYTELEYQPNKTFFTTINAIPPFMHNIETPMAPVQGAEDEITCPNYEGGVGRKTGSFTLPTAMNVALAWTFRATPGNIEFCSLTIERPDNSNPIIHIGYTEEGTEDLYLPAGTYTYTIDAGCASAQPGNNNIARFWLTEYLPQPGGMEIEVGGNRVHRIKSYDATTNKTTVKRYEYYKPEFYQIPYYVNAVSMLTTNTDGMDLPGYLNCGKLFTIGAYNLVPFEGSTVYYDSVVEYHGENGENGKMVYIYDQQYLYTDTYDQDPYPQITNLTWRASEPKIQELYQKDGSGFILRQRATTTYTDPPLLGSMYQMTQGVKFGIIGSVMAGVPEPQRYYDYYAQGQVYLPNDRYDKASVTTIEYTNDGNITSVVNYNYNDNYFLPSKVQRIDSKGKNEEQYFWYPGDYNTNVSNTASLIANNIVGLPQKMLNVRNGNIISGQVHDYDNQGNLIRVHKYENSLLAPMPAHNPAILYPADFNLKLNLNYTASSKVRQLKPQDNQSTAVLWGYNNTYPIAEVKGATYQELIDVLGQSAINQLSGNAPGTDNQVRTILNMLRTDARLKDKLVTTYTYLPSVGMTSQTDPAGRTTYYEYDNLARLTVVRDQNQKVIKKMEYKFQSQ